VAGQRDGLVEQPCSSARRARATSRTSSRSVAGSPRRHLPRRQQRHAQFRGRRSQGPRPWG
jgi:hypothetical protein